MGKPKHQERINRASTWVGLQGQRYDVWRVPACDEIIKVVGLRPDGMSVTSIRDNHQQVHEMTFPQDEE